MRRRHQERQSRQERHQRTRRRPQDSTLAFSGSAHTPGPWWWAPTDCTARPEAGCLATLPPTRRQERLQADERQRQTRRQSARLAARSARPTRSGRGFPLAVEQVIYLLRRELDKIIDIWAMPTQKRPRRPDCMRAI